MNAVNMAGIMGRGVALRFKETVPKNFAAYANAWNRSTGGGMEYVRAGLKPTVGEVEGLRPALPS